MPPAASGSDADGTGTAASRPFEAIIETQAALVAGVFDLAGFMELVVVRVQDTTGADGAVIELAESDEIVCMAASGSAAVFAGRRIPSAGSLAERAIADRRVIVVSNTTTDPEARGPMQAMSVAVAPVFQRGAAIGALKIVSRAPDAFADGEVDVLRLMAGLVGSALGQQSEIDHRRRIEERLQHVAHTDALTDLPNRQMFGSRFERAALRSARSGKLLALFAMDIDGFRRINDTLGQGSGDALLGAFSRRVQSLTRQTDTLARMGGDEFALIAEDFPYVAAAERTAATIIEAVSRPFALVDGNVAEIGVSIGVVIAGGRSVDRERMIRTADDALSRVKRKGGRGSEVVILPRSDASPQTARVLPRT